MWGEEPAFIKVLQQRARSLNIKKLYFNKGSQMSQVKEFSILCMGRCKPLCSLSLLLWICASAVWGPTPVSLLTVRIGRWLLLVFPQLLSNPSRYGSIRWITVLGALIHIWKPEINHWWLWHFLLVNMAEDIFISHCPAKYFEALPRSYCKTGGPKSFTETNH